MSEHQLKIIFSQAYYNCSCNFVQLLARKECVVSLFSFCYFTVGMYLLHHLLQQTPPSGANRQTSMCSSPQPLRAHLFSLLKCVISSSLAVRIQSTAFKNKDYLLLSGTCTVFALINLSKGSVFILSCQKQ